MQDVQPYLYQFQGFTQDLMMLIGNLMKFKLRVPGFFKKAIYTMTEKTVNDIYDKNDFSDAGPNSAIFTAVTLATVGLVLTMVVRTLAVGLVHRADAAAENGDFRGVAFWHYVSLSMQGLRIMIPAGALLFVSSEVVQEYLKLIPEWFANGMTIGGNMVVAVGLAMVINLMASKETWPFFFIGFAIAPLNELTLIATGVIALSLAFIYLNLSNNSGNGSAGGNSGSGDPLGDILNDY